MGLASPVTAAVRGVGATVDGPDRILCSLETLGGSISLGRSLKRIDSLVPRRSRRPR